MGRIYRLNEARSVVKNRLGFEMYPRPPILDDFSKITT